MSSAPRERPAPLPVVFYIYGTGWVFGDDRTHDRLFRELTVGAGAAGVFPVYDRAPEAKYPTQVEQNHAVGRWVLRHGAEHGLAAGRATRPGTHPAIALASELRKQRRALRSCRAGPARSRTTQP